MPNNRVLDLLPAWLIFVGTTALVMVSIYGGVFLARLRRRRSPQEKEASISTLVGATTALLAFLLAFTFGLAASRFDAKRTFLLDEVNAIGTAFLRTGLIPEPHRTAVRALLQEYVDLRVELYRHPEKAEQLIQRSGELQGLMWPHAEALAHADLQNPPVVALFVSALNEMFDIQTKRITVGVFYQMPVAIWIALLVLTVLSMLEVGYLLGTSDHANWILVLLVSLALATVILLIVDLDRSGVRGAGLIKVEQEPMLDLQQWIHQQMSSGQAGARSARLFRQTWERGPWPLCDAGGKESRRGRQGVAGPGRVPNRDRSRLGAQSESPAGCCGRGPENTGVARPKTSVDSEKSQDAGIAMAGRRHRNIYFTWQCGVMNDEKGNMGSAFPDIRPAGLLRGSCGTGSCGFWGSPTRRRMSRACPAGRG